ncbi:MAG: Fic family protein [Calothrix sp. SM1_5_4]|nr:Fic family protein [Calothrix sp. SM1_5_4]
MQKLAVAHIETQKAAEELLRIDETVDVFSSSFLKWLHKEFYSRLPRAFLTLEFKEENRTVDMVPGEIRDIEVRVGRHYPPRAARLNEFLARFDQFYSSQDHDPLTRIIGAAAAHHRLGWIHPFLDGNGRVMRLFSDCLFMKENLGGFGLWTISRGLARKKEKYYEMLATGDDQRRNDYDGRGNLSDESLGAFCEFFLDVAIDQVEFMSAMLNLDHFERRLGRLIAILVDRQLVRDEAFFLLRDLFTRGQIGRGEAPRIMNMNERTARDIVAQLTKLKMVFSETPKSALRLRFNPFFAHFVFPSLYPETIEFNEFLARN